MWSNFLCVPILVPYWYHITDVLDLNQFVFHQVCCAMCKKNLKIAFVFFQWFGIRFFSIPDLNNKIKSTAVRINREKDIFCVLRLLEQLKNSKTSRVVYFYVFLSLHVNKSRIHLIRLSFLRHERSFLCVIDYWVNPCHAGGILFIPMLQLNWRKPGGCGGRGRVRPGLRQDPVLRQRDPAQVLPETAGSGGGHRQVLHTWLMLSLLRVSDPHWFNADPDPAFF